MKTRAQPDCIPIALMLLAVSAMAGEGSEPPAPVVDESGMEVVLVTGEQPGPSLWKVTSGDHVLWILGEVMPLPRHMKWRSKRFEQLLRESQEVLIDDSDNVPAPANQREWLAVYDVGELPAGQTLQQLVSPAMYARAKALQKKFRTKDIDALPPWAAKSRLYYSAVRAMGLVEFNASEAAEKLAKKSKVRITTIAFKPAFAQYIGYLRTAPGDLCLSPVVDILEDGGSGIRRLANAWSIGDIDQLRQLVPAHAYVSESWRAGRLSVCQYGGPQRAEEYFAKRSTAWLQESERVLRDNHSTMAIMPMGWLVAPDGYVAQLRARGYEVAEPE